MCLFVKTTYSIGSHSTYTQIKQNKIMQPTDTETGCLYLKRMRNPFLSPNVKDLLPG